jgi:hypothetical protein
VCVSVLLLDLFQDDLRCLFSPHQVNHGGVQKPPAGGVQKGLGKSSHPMRNSRLLFLVRLSFTTSTKYWASHFLRPRRGCYLCAISHL